MSHPQGVPGPSVARNQQPVPKCKRLRTKRERNAAKFGPKAAPGGSRRGLAAAPRWLQPPPRRGLALGSPLPAPKPVVITESRLCHRGLFNREIKSLDVRRLLSLGPGGDGPGPGSGAGEAGRVPAEALKELTASLASLLGSLGVFEGRDLVSERRRSLLAALRRHRRGPPDLGIFLAHRTPAQPPGQGIAQAPWQEVRPGPPGRAVSLGGWEVGDPPARTPSPVRVGDRLLPPPPSTPSPIFGAPREQENPFSWSSAEDEEDETPRGLPQTWGAPGGLLLGPPAFWRSPQPPQEEEEEEDGGDEGWTPIAPPTFSLDPPPWGSPRPRDTRGLPRAPRPSRAPKICRHEAPWHPPDPSRSPRDAPRPPWDSPDAPRTHPRFPWELPDPARAPPRSPRLPRATQIWSLEPRKAPPDPLRPLWDPPNASRPPWDPRPRSLELPRAALDPPRPPRTPQLWNPEPPRAPLDAPRPLWDPPRPHWDPPAALGPLWDSPEPPRAPLDPRRSPQSAELWSPERPPRPSRDPRPWSPEPSRCCCCRRLCRDTARHAGRRHSPCRDPSQRCPQPPKRRRPGWAGVGRRGGPRASPRSPPRPPGCRCPCTGVCCAGGVHVRRGL